MNPTVAFLTDVLFVVILSLGARFWLTFSNVTLVSGPNQNFIFEMATQLKHAIIGFVIALSSLAIILLRFIPRDKPSVVAGSSR